jgi:mono/diheme cytochrome c family protein
MRNDSSDHRRTPASRRCALQAAAAALGISLLSAFTAAASTPVGNAARGKTLFVKNGCYACHGYEGQGSIYTGPRIAPNPLPWQAIAAFIRNPPGLKRPYSKWPAHVMPPFTAKMVSDSDLRDIYAYLKSVPGPAALRRIPTFKK